MGSARPGTGGATSGAVTSRKTGLDHARLMFCGSGGLSASAVTFWPLLCASVRECARAVPSARSCERRLRRVRGPTHELLPLERPAEPTSDSSRCDAHVVYCDVVLHGRLTGDFGDCASGGRSPLRGAPAA